MMFVAGKLLGGRQNRSVLETLQRVTPWNVRTFATGTMTKIVCTLGPSTDQPGPVSELIANGMHVARLNFSHAGSDYSYPESNMALVRNGAGLHTELAAGSTHPLPANLRAVLVDTKGPEIRTGPCQGNVDIIEIASGATVVLTTSDVSGDAVPESADGPHRLNVDYANICQTLTVGDRALLDDGLIALEVKDVDQEGVTCVALNGGPIKKNKGVNLPDSELDLPALTEKDKRDLRWACEQGADFVAASFIRTPGNVRSVKAYLDRCVAKLNSNTEHVRPLVISKIESREGVDNFKGILAESDGIMVARGDLGVEIPYSKVFAAQKMMVSACNAVGKPVIVATQMLDSMQRNPRPTRAEVTDVGTAVLDGADAVMLSGETAAGKYPIDSLKAMSRIVSEADAIVDSGKCAPPTHLNVDQNMSNMDIELESLAQSAVDSAKDLKARLIIVVTMGGRVAKAVARHRPTVPVLAFCTDVKIARQLQLHRGISPFFLPCDEDVNSADLRMEGLRTEAVLTAKELGLAHAGDRIVTVDRTLGKPNDMHTFSHNMKLWTLRE